MNMEDLEQCFKKAMKDKANYIAVKIETKGCKAPEVIINPYENFETKLDYYQNAYSDDLALKNCKDIKITDFMAAYNFEELEHLICYSEMN
jgi:hypothetical protein